MDIDENELTMGQLITLNVLRSAVGEGLGEEVFSTLLARREGAAAARRSAAGKGGAVALRTLGL